MLVADISRFLMPQACPNRTKMGKYCNSSAVPCEILQPCQNNGSCVNNYTIPHGFTCWCPTNIHGILCNQDRRPCQRDTCWNGGMSNLAPTSLDPFFRRCCLGQCKAVSNQTFHCQCVNEWVGHHCEKRKNYCDNATCQNNGQCRSLMHSYLCECLGDSYSGLHCEKTSTRIAVYQTVSKSLGYVGILSLVSFTTFIVTMDILKYGFGIDPVSVERELLRQKTRPKNRRVLLIQRFIYVDRPPPMPGACEDHDHISTMRETVIWRNSKETVWLCFLFCHARSSACFAHPHCVGERIIR